MLTIAIEWLSRRLHKHLAKFWWNQNIILLRLGARFLRALQYFSTPNFVCLFRFFETESHFVAQASLKLTM